MAVRIQPRRDTKSNWFFENPILEEGEVGIETDTFQQKIGNGLSPWNDLEYIGNPVLQDLGDSEIEALSQKTITENLKAVQDVANNLLIDYGRADSVYGGAPKLDFGDAATVPIDFTV